MSLYRRARHLVGYVMFERRYGVRTAGIVQLEDLGLAHSDRQYYIASNWRLLRRALHPKEVSPQDVFIDFGSGMGRVIVEASQYPFKRIIGVELSEKLTEIARANVTNMRVRRRCTEIELVVSDVLDYQIPDDVTVAFFLNPFRGKIFTDVIDRIVSSVDRNPRRVRIIYANPTEDEYLASHSRFRHIRTIMPRKASPDGLAFGAVRIYDLS